MIRIDGQLAIRTIPGRHGKFNVGRLITSIGEFAVKDALLEQYTEGKYEGSFVIAHISPSSYSTAGRTVIEVRAKLDSMTLSDMDSLSPADTERLDQKEPDPLDEEQASASTPTTPVPTPVASAKLCDDTPFGMTPAELKPTSTPPAQHRPATTDAGDAELFGTLWPLDDSVKLDPTVDRQRLRAQCARLEQLGFSLDFKAQVWLRQS